MPRVHIRGHGRAAEAPGFQPGQASSTLAARSGGRGRRVEALRCDRSPSRFESGRSPRCRVRLLMRSLVSQASQMGSIPIRDATRVGGRAWSMALACRARGASPAVVQIHPDAPASHARRMRGRGCEPRAGRFDSCMGHQRGRASNRGRCARVKSGRAWVGTRARHSGRVGPSAWTPACRAGSKRVRLPHAAPIRLGWRSGTGEASKALQRGSIPRLPANPARRVQLATTAGP